MPLVLCYTPLHVLIVERLLSGGQLTQFCLVYLCFDDNPKHAFYFRRLEGRAVRAVMVKMTHRPVRDALKLLRLRLLGLGSERPTALLTGNLKHFYSRALMLLFSLKSVSTFDDGSGNVSGSGYFYEMTERPISRLVFSVLSPSLLYRHAVFRIRRHFTIYAYPNVYDGMAAERIEIDLLGQSYGGNDEGLPEKVIYLGNVFSGDGLCSPEYEYALDDYVLRRYSVGFVIPHPRRPEVATFLAAGCEVIKSPCVAEEIVFAELERGFRVHLVGAYSSVLLNLAGVPGICLTNVSCCIGKPVQQLEEHLRLAGVRMDKMFLEMPKA